LLQVAHSQLVDEAKAKLLERFKDLGLAPSDLDSLWGRLPVLFIDQREWWRNANYRYDEERLLGFILAKILEIPCKVEADVLRISRSIAEEHKTRLLGGLASSENLSEPSQALSPPLKSGPCELNSGSPESGVSRDSDERPSPEGIGRRDAPQGSKAGSAAAGTIGIGADPIAAAAVEVKGGSVPRKTWGTATKVTTTMTAKPVLSDLDPDLADKMLRRKQWEGSSNATSVDLPAVTGAADDQERKAQAQRPGPSPSADGAAAKAGPGHAAGKDSTSSSPSVLERRKLSSCGVMVSPAPTVVGPASTEVGAGVRVQGVPTRIDPSKGQAESNARTGHVSESGAGAPAPTLGRTWKCPSQTAPAAESLGVDGNRELLDRLARQRDRIERGCASSGIKAGTQPSEPLQ
jgi:hypothetical protein